MHKLFYMDSKAKQSKLIQIFIQNLTRVINDPKINKIRIINKQAGRMNKENMSLQIISK